MKLTNRARMERAAIAAVLAMLFAGSAAAVTASALNAGVPAAPLYLSALLAVGLCAAALLSRLGSVIASVGFVALAALYAASNAAGLGALRAVFAAWSGAPADAAQVALGCRTLLTCGAFAFAALFFALLDRREFVSTAIMLLLAILVACHAMSETASVAATVPGLIAAAAAFALTGGVQRDLTALRVLAPAALAVMLALALMPGAGTTWQPLEDAAERVRSVFEQYFRFTKERVAFSIIEEGYDHAGEVGDSVVAMLGGPAEPHTDPVMSVQTDVDVLLRGAIRTAYTGYSWVDAAPKSRFLYYDLTHRATRDRVFTPGAPLEGALLSVDVSVEMLNDGTSTLFVPGLLEQFDMDLSAAVYYNTAGEMFLARRVQPGDRYALRALLPEQNDALRRATIEGEAVNDDRYQDVLEQHIQLPDGIEGGVYTLVGQITRDAETPYDRAVAIMNWLRKNIKYNLRPEMPPKGRDFVSYFLLDTKEGYCSYYASAMAVMGRIAGLPTRYVEGYLARPGLEVLTGENAHAWAEVYFRGIGWIPFDATGGVSGSGAAWDPYDPEGPGEGDAAEGDYDGDGGEPTPTPEPDAGLPPDAPEDTPTPAPDDGFFDEPTPPDAPDDVSDGAQDAESDLPETSDRSGGRWWLLFILLILIALGAFAARWVRRRLRESDPARLCAQAKGLRRAAMIAYRANLTALLHLGQTPSGGETPEAFADRVAEAFANPDFAAFTRTVVNMSYGRRALKKDDIDTGLRAYDRFRSCLGRRERLRFMLTRVTRGLGDFETIP